MNYCITLSDQSTQLFQILFTRNSHGRGQFPVWTKLQLCNHLCSQQCWKDSKIRNILGMLVEATFFLHIFINLLQH